MGALVGAHHHQSTTKQSNKPFKSRHASKSEIKERAKGKVERFEAGTRRTPHQQMLSKLDRRNQAKQKRNYQSAKKDEENSLFTGRDGAPRIIAVVPLCADADAAEIVRNLNHSVDVEGDAINSRYEVARFKQRVQYLTPRRELFTVLDACRVADFVLFVLSAENEVDQLGEQMLKCIESQGVSTVVTGVHNLSAVEPAKRRADVSKSLKSYITHFFATQEKVHDLSNRQECSNIMRSLCTTSPKGIRWREDRSWMVVDELRWQGEQFVVTGVVRGRALKADRLVQVGDWGDFQVDKICAAPLSHQKKHAKSSEMAIDPQESHILDQATDERDDLDELAPEEIIMDEGTRTYSMAPSERKHVLLDDHTYHDDDDEEIEDTKPRRLPRGTSKYQAAWYLEDPSDSDSDLESVVEDDEEFEGSPEYGPADGHFDAAPEPTEGAPSEYPQSEAFDDRAPEDEADQLAAYRKARKEEAEDDLEFPDEIELHPHVSARERLIKYRGLKSLRTSVWDTEEDLPFQPSDWDRMLEIADPKAARNRVLKDTLIGGVKAGSRVDVYFNASATDIEQLKTLARPTALFSLLKHEHKRTVINASITLPSDYPSPLKSKTELILQCGPRRLRINPLFSQAGNTPNNVHKFERYLHPGRTAVASFIGPVCWGSVPVIYFMPAQAAQAEDAVEDLAQAMDSDDSAAALEPIATGTLMPPSTSRIIAKRIILAGNPYKIHKRLVTIRYMFFHNEDVEYFKSLPLWTRRGRSGYIKETLGTHGYFKATFDGKINPMDSVGISLYKRVWPRAASLWRPSDVAASKDAEAMEMS